MCKMFALFTQDNSWQVSLSSLAVIYFGCCNAEPTRLHVRCQRVCVHFRGGNLDKYRILPNLYPNINFFEVQ